VPERSRATAILRDDILAQLRTAQRPLTTSELRTRAPKVPVSGIAYPIAPLREQVYTVLRALERDGMVTRSGPGEGGTVTWSALPSAADEEIADLEPTLASDTTRPVSLPTVAAQHLKAAARTATRAAAHSTDYPVTTALSRVVHHWADILLIGADTPDVDPR
jgi:hypothetical protein